MCDLSELVSKIVQACPGSRVTVITIEPAIRDVPAQTNCEEDVLATLHEVGHRLMVEQLLSEMQQRGRLHGESTIRRAVSRMRKDNRLTHEDVANPRGFGLPEWNGKH